MQASRLTPALLPFLLVACQSTSEGVFSLEGRAIVYDDTTVDDVDAATTFDEEDVDVSAYGVQAALMTPIVDGLASIDWREYERETTPELNVGARRRFFEVGPIHPFVEGNLRYGIDLDTGQTSDDYFGWNAGVGTLIDVTEDLFLNLRVMYEAADIDLPAGSETVDGVIATVGIGLAF